MKKDNMNKKIIKELDPNNNIGEMNIQGDMLDTEEGANSFKIVLGDKNK